MTKTFLTQPTELAALYLRRYVSASGGQCSGAKSYHDNMVYFGEVGIKVDAEGCWSETERINLPHDDPRWPTHCTCGLAFTEADEWQEFHDRLYTDGPRTWPKRELPVGAMFYADWLPSNMFWDNKTDGHLTVITPGGEWNIDQRASNCTLPYDRLHRCWVRHGEPPMVHVDKAGHTCAAGAGSILLQNYHGFLHYGNLT
jgi:hypothetical protein